MIIKEKRGIIRFTGEDAKRMNEMLKNPNKETMRKRDAYFKEIKETVKLVSREKGRSVYEVKLEDGEW